MPLPGRARMTTTPQKLLPMDREKCEGVSKQNPLKSHALEDLAVIPDARFKLKAGWHRERALG